ncbi:hypothetical protein CDD83_7844 [Cordyceps sp. RAO-2017]|nr:hypothetical protein CDD83_7844 [Cordyceps sp. RAO-2017]
MMKHLYTAAVAILASPALARPEPRDHKNLAQNLTWYLQQHVQTACDGVSSENYTACWERANQCIRQAYERNYRTVQTDDEAAVVKEDALSCFNENKATLVGSGTPGLMAGPELISFYLSKVAETCPGNVGTEAKTECDKLVSNCASEMHVSFLGSYLPDEIRGIFRCVEKKKRGPRHIKLWPPPRDSNGVLEGVLGGLAVANNLDQTDWE